MGDIISASITEIAATGASQREIARNVVNRLPEYLLETHHGH